MRATRRARVILINSDQLCDPTEHYAQSYLENRLKRKCQQSMMTSEACT